MPDLDCIEDALQATGWNRARIRLLARFLVALIVCRTVCLSRLANALPGSARTQSHYKRLCRFVAGFDLDFDTLARLIVAIAGRIGLWPPFVLALDRTNWKLGRAELNVLVLAAVHRGVAFPLFWSVLDRDGTGKAGNSNLRERQALLQRYLGVFGAESIAYLCADREFGGRAFLAWLQKSQIGFVIRLRGTVKVSNAKGQQKTARGLFWHVPAGEAVDLGQRRVFGSRPLPLFVSGMRAKDGDFVIVVSDHSDHLGSKTGDLLEKYRLRWGIETLFGCLKRRGFDLEATHLTRAERLSRLLAVLTLAFSWAYVVGVWLYEQAPWEIKKHGRLAVSLFRKGLDRLQQVLMPLCGRPDRQAIQVIAWFLSST
jgi:hypothetical protein